MLSFWQSNVSHSLVLCFTDVKAAGITVPQTEFLKPLPDLSALTNASNPSANKTNPTRGVIAPCGMHSQRQSLTHFLKVSASSLQMLDRRRIGFQSSVFLCRSVRKACDQSIDVVKQRPLTRETIAKVSRPSKTRSMFGFASSASVTSNWVLNDQLASPIPI